MKFILDTARLKDISWAARSEEHTSELQSQSNLVCRLLLEKKKRTQIHDDMYRALEKHLIQNNSATNIVSKQITLHEIITAYCTLKNVTMNDGVPKHRSLL